MFKIGDKVTHKQYGDGRIVTKLDSEGFIDVEYLESQVGFHSCKDKGRKGYCWYTYPNEIRPTEPAEISSEINLMELL